MSSSIAAAIAEVASAWRSAATATLLEAWRMCSALLTRLMALC